MMVKAKGINVSISTIYYWIHHGYLGLTEADMLYPRRKSTLVLTLSLPESLLKNVQRVSISVRISVILRLIPSFRHELKK